MVRGYSVRPYAGGDVIHNLMVLEGSAMPNGVSRGEEVAFDW